MADHSLESLLQINKDGIKTKYQLEWELKEQAGAELGQAQPNHPNNYHFIKISLPSKIPINHQLPQDTPQIDHAFDQIPYILGLTLLREQYAYPKN